MKTNCKPCMTIRTFFYLLKKNYKQFRQDLKDYSKVNYYACEIPKYKRPQNIEEGMKELKRVREIAKTHHNPKVEKEILKELPKL
jgi:hypothetical protein